MSRAISGRPEHKEEEILRDTGDGKLVVTRLRERVMAFLIKDNRLFQVSVLPDSGDAVGTIYLGKVKKVVRNIACCFVEIRKGVLVYLALEDSPYSRPVNRLPDGRILEGDELLVQIQREALKTKQAAGTTKLSLAGKYVVLQVGDPKTGFSAKLDSAQKKRIFKALREQGLVDEEGRSVLASWDALPSQDASSIAQDVLTSQDALTSLDALPSFGAIVRTEAGQASNEEILEEYTQLKERLRRIYQGSRHAACFTRVDGPSPLEALAVFPREYKEIVTDQETLYPALQKAVQERAEEGVTLRFYEDPADSLARLYALESKLEKALSRRIWLKSGAYLVIDHTEAFTVFDVNSGKFSAKMASEDAAFRINLEAAREIAFQMRLRNLSGIILVDFISMNSARFDAELLHELREAVKEDKVPTKVVDMTALGLVEITRKKINKTLAEQLAETNKSEETK